MACAVLVAACGQWHGVNSLDLPGTRGHGDGAFDVTLEMPDVTTLQRNSRVRVGDVTVGRVSGLRLADGHAEVTVTLDPDVELPANAVARIGQTSLLGSAHVELSAPTDTPPRGRLREGDVVPLERAGAFPTTEQTLSSLSLVLGGGGLAQVQDITRELDAAMSGRQDSVRDLIVRLDTVLAGLDDQKKQIVHAMESVDALAAEVAEHNEQIGAASDQLAPTLDVLARERTDLTDAADALGRFGRIATDVVSAGGDAMVADLQDLEPVLASLTASGDSLTESMRYLATFPFPIDTYRNAVRGDYANGTVILDLTLPTLDNALFLGTSLEGLLSGGGDRPAPDLASLLVPAVGASR
ncbi:MCE family protein [Rhodococcus sp. HNM0569]|nr:MCE family protein [Rhodococcus sp. HNM0569]NLU82412.1 MCE family protein [Rhodococcus sp. HNM0569]